MSNSTNKRLLVRAFGVIVTALALALTTAYFLRFSLTGDNGTRVRNSLVAEIGKPEDFVWSPDHAPQSFMLEHHAVPGNVQSIADRILASAPADQKDSELDKALLISRHLVTNKGNGQAIQSDTTTAYEGIMQGRGYCADFTQVFTALATAMDIPAREWGFGFEGYGAGHAFNEIYIDDLDKWVFIDSFNSMYFVDSTTRTPLSATEIQDRFEQNPDHPALDVVRISNDKFAFPSDANALHYYALGVNQFYLVWGNDVFSYDDNPVVRLLSTIARPVEVFGAIVLGIHPKIRIAAMPGSQQHLAELFRTRWIFLGLGSAISLLLVLLTVQSIALWRRLRD